VRFGTVFPNPVTIDGLYVDGISITIGSPRKHVWTYAASLSDDYDYSCCNCPCDKHPGPSPPTFVGYNYYCKSEIVGKEHDHGFYYLSDPLWDGSDCTAGNSCCAQI